MVRWANIIHPSACAASSSRSTGVGAPKRNYYGLVKQKDPAATNTFFFNSSSLVDCVKVQTKKSLDKHEKYHKFYTWVITLLVLHTFCPLQYAVYWQPIIDNIEHICLMIYTP